jgi:hypothetical protein
VARVAGVLVLGLVAVRALSNERVLQPGGAAGRVLTRLEDAVRTSLTHVAAGEDVARCRRANR